MITNKLKMNVLKDLMPLWEAQNIGFIEGSSEDNIKKVFSNLGFRATRDVVEVYSTIGGMSEMEADACWRLWSLVEIVERNVGLPPSPYGILFSDHLMDSWCYRLKYETDNCSSIYVDHFDPERVPEKIFDGFEEFFTAYAKNPDSIL